jgi:hypothetical protein
VKRCYAARRIGGAMLIAPGAIGGGNAACVGERESMLTTRECVVFLSVPREIDTMRR